MSATRCTRFITIRVGSTPRAECSCGWTGPARRSYDDAKPDRNQHRRDHVAGIA